MNKDMKADLIYGGANVPQPDWRRATPMTRSTITKIPHL